MIIKTMTIPNLGENFRKVLLNFINNGCPQTKQLGYT
jgi:hypothetical protein